MSYSDRVHRRASLVAVTLGLLSWVVWIANWLGTTLLRPHDCSPIHMQVFSWLLIARLPAAIAPAAGLALVFLAGRNPSAIRGAGIVLNVASLLFVVAVIADLVPVGRLPCVRS